MKRRTKQFVTACLIVAAVTGTGAVSARAEEDFVAVKPGTAKNPVLCIQGKTRIVTGTPSRYL